MASKTLIIFISNIDLTFKWLYGKKTAKHKKGLVLQFEGHLLMFRYKPKINGHPTAGLSFLI